MRGEASICSLFPGFLKKKKGTNSCQSPGGEGRCSSGAQVPPLAANPAAPRARRGRQKLFPPEGSVALGGAWTCRQNRARRMRWEAGGTHPDSRGAFSSGPSSAPCPPPDPPRASSSRRRNGSTSGAPWLPSRELSRLFVAAKASARSAPLRCSGPRRAAEPRVPVPAAEARRGRGGAGTSERPPSADLSRFPAPPFPGAPSHAVPLGKAAVRVSAGAEPGTRSLLGPGRSPVTRQSRSSTVSKVPVWLVWASLLSSWL